MPPPPAAPPSPLVPELSPVFDSDDDLGDMDYSEESDQEMEGSDGDSGDEEISDGDDLPADGNVS